VPRFRGALGCGEYSEALGGRYRLRRSDNSAANFATMEHELVQVFAHARSERPEHKVASVARIVGQRRRKFADRANVHFRHVNFFFSNFSFFATDFILFFLSR
jgi:hypothetical protein